MERMDRLPPLHVYPPGYRAVTSRLLRLLAIQVNTLISGEVFIRLISALYPGTKVLRPLLGRIDSR
jgi:hypothetical protein